MVFSNFYSSDICLSSILYFTLLCPTSLLIMMVLLSTVIKQRMEKEVDEVGKVARLIKSKIEELDREVRL